ncbi:MAG: hypothetical protein R3B96_21555 [Pirellulaceae bacterium]
MSAWPGWSMIATNSKPFTTLTQVALLGGHHDFQPTLAGRKWSVNAAVGRSSR